MIRDLSRSLLVLDTNILVHLVRGNAFGEGLDRAYGLRTRTERPIVSRVTVVELASLAEQFGWGEAKRRRLVELVAHQLVIVEIHAAVIVEAWARFHTYLKASGRAVGDNDVWIAATAGAVGGVLVTTDKDFEPLAAKGRLDWLYVEPPTSK